jgi:hypothetical protein
MNQLVPANLLPFCNETRDPETLYFALEELPRETPERLIVCDYRNVAVYTDGTCLQRDIDGGETCLLSGIVFVHPTYNWLVVDVVTDYGTDTLALVNSDSGYEWVTLAHGESVFHDSEVGQHEFDSLYTIDSITNELVYYKDRLEVNRQPMSYFGRFIDHGWDVSLFLEDDGLTIHYNLGERYTRTPTHTHSLEFPRPIKPLVVYKLEGEYFMFIDEMDRPLVYKARLEIQPIADFEFDEERTKSACLMFDGCRVVDVTYCYILLGDGRLLKFTMNGWLSVLRSNSTIIGTTNPRKSALMN